MLRRNLIELFIQCGEPAQSIVNAIKERLRHPCHSPDEERLGFVGANASKACLPQRGSRPQIQTRRDRAPAYVSRIGERKDTTQ